MPEKDFFLQKFASQKSQIPIPLSQNIRFPPLPSLPGNSVRRLWTASNWLIFRIHGSIFQCPNIYFRPFCLAVSIIIAIICLTVTLNIILGSVQLLVQNGIPIHTYFPGKPSIDLYLLFDLFIFLISNIIGISLIFSNNSFPLSGIRHWIDTFFHFFHFLFFSFRFY